MSKKNDTDARQTDRQTQREIDRRKRIRSLFSYLWDHETSKKYESGNSPDGFDY